MILLICILLSYSLITSAREVEEIKREAENTRESLMEDNLIVWRNFPLRVVKSFPDFVMYLKEICVNRNYNVINQ